MENIKEVYQNIIELLDEKATITLGEVRHIRRAVDYIRSKEEDESTQQQSELPQFIKDCILIRDSLKSLAKKIKDYRDDLKVVNEEILKNNQPLIADNMHLQLLLKLDCMQKRSFSLAEKLEYLYRAYENLIAPYNYLYLPMPSISKRIKTSNLMLFFNSELNKDFQYIKEYFFKISSDDQEKKEKVFSTWNFSSYEHIKEIDDSNRIFVSLSFWFYEKQIFYPIAYHEIAHAIYMDDAYKEKLRGIKLTEEEKTKITQELLQSNEGIFVRSMIYTIYQDIVADFSAYSLSGASYIFALFYTGFMQNIHQNFYRDYYIESEIHQEKVKDEKRKCSEQHKDMTLLDWAHDLNSRNKNFLSFYIRLKLLIKLHTGYFAQNRQEPFYDHIQGISSILDLIYPDKDFKKQYNTFENILTSYEPQKYQYDYMKNFTLLLLRLLDDVVFKDKKLHDRVSETIIKAKEKFNENITFKEIVQPMFTKGADETGGGSSIYEKFDSQYDLYWERRFRRVKSKEKIFLGRLLRLYNLTKLNIIKSSSRELGDVIYELIFIKFHQKPNPLLTYMQGEFWIDSGQTEQSGNKKSYDKQLSDARFTYAFGAYDNLILSKNKTNQIDRFLHQQSKNSTFFTERHTLYLLDEIPQKEDQTASFDLCLSIDFKQELSHINSDRDYNELVQKVNAIKASFSNIKIFASMGNENYIVYIRDIMLNEIDDVTTNFYQLPSIKNISTTILLNENARRDKENIKMAGRTFVILCKLKKNDKDYDETLASISKKIDIYKTKSPGAKAIMFKKYGIFDLLITFEGEINLGNVESLIGEIDEYVSDVQFELQNNFQFFESSSGGVRKNIQGEVSALFKRVLRRFRNMLCSNKQ